MPVQIEMKLNILDTLRQLGVSEEDIVDQVFDALVALSKEGVISIQVSTDLDADEWTETPARYPIEWLNGPGDPAEISLGLDAYTTIRHVWGEEATPVNDVS